MCSRRDRERCEVRSLDGNLQVAGESEFTDRGAGKRLRTVCTPINNTETNTEERRSLPNHAICVQTSFRAEKNASRTKKRGERPIGCKFPVLFG